MVLDPKRRRSGSIGTPCPARWTCSRASHAARAFKAFEVPGRAASHGLRAFRHVLSTVSPALVALQRQAEGKELGEMAGGTLNSWGSSGLKAFGASLGPGSTAAAAEWQEISKKLAGKLKMNS